MITQRSNAADWQKFGADAAEMGVPLDDEAIRQFQHYTQLLDETNRDLNLTAIRDIPAMIAKLHLDSLSMLPAIAAAEGMNTAELRSQPWRIIDIGTGAGIPGIPLHFAWPSAEFTLVESTKKKVAFLTQVIFRMNLTVSVLSERSEAVGKQGKWREQFDLVVARAVAALPTLVELTLPFAKHNGLVALPKGPRAEQELADAAPAIERLGGVALTLTELKIPGVDEKRFLVLLRKVHPTPENYPRRPGLPAKRPLK